MYELLGILALTGKRFTGYDSSTTKGHLLFCNHTQSQFLHLTTDKNDYRVFLMESLLINRDHSFE